MSFVLCRPCQSEASTLLKEGWVLCLIALIKGGPNTPGQQDWNLPCSALEKVQQTAVKLLDQLYTLWRILNYFLQSLRDQFGPRGIKRLMMKNPFINIISTLHHKIESSAWGLFLSPIICFWAVLTKLKFPNIFQIWKTFHSSNSGTGRSKSFRYPPILEQLELEQLEPTPSCMELLFKVFQSTISLANTNLTKGKI